MLVLLQLSSVCLLALPPLCSSVHPHLVHAICSRYADFPDLVWTHTDIIPHGFIDSAPLRARLHIVETLTARCSAPRTPLCPYTPHAHARTRTPAVARCLDYTATAHFALCTRSQFCLGTHCFFPFCLVLLDSSSVRPPCSSQWWSTPGIAGLHAPPPSPCTLPSSAYLHCSPATTTTTCFMPRLCLFCWTYFMAFTGCWGYYYLHCISPALPLPAVPTLPTCCAWIPVDLPPPTIPAWLTAVVLHGTQANSSPPTLGVHLPLLPHPRIHCLPATHTHTHSLPACFHVPFPCHPLYLPLATFSYPSTSPVPAPTTTHCKPSSLPAPHSPTTC